MMQQENIRAISLSEMGENSTGNIAKIEGDSRFISRIISIGLTPGSSFTLLKNDGRVRALSLKLCTEYSLLQNTAGPHFACIHGGTALYWRPYTAHVRRQVRNLEQRIAARELRNRRDNTDCAIHL